MPDPARGEAAAGRARWNPSAPRAGVSAPGAAPRSRVFTRRRLWHLVALVLALLVAWIVMRAYRQPEFILDFANLLLC